MTEAPAPRLLRLGSLLCSVGSSPAHYARVLADVYGTPLLEASGIDSEPIGLSIRICEQADAAPGDSDALRVERVAGGYLLDTDPLSCHLSLEQDCPHAEILVKQPGMGTEPLAFHFWLLTNRLLLLLDRVLLHAAAIDYQDQVLLFSGRKRAGKSTVSIALGQAGAVILAEDHVILHRRDDGFLVSGCTSRIRVTAETENGLLAGQLHSSAVDVGGTPKKQFPAEQFFSTCPYTERRPSRLFLARVGTTLSLRPASAREALLWMLDTTGEMLRFSKREDYASFLAFLSPFVASVSTYALELSPDVSEVKRLPGMLADLLDRNAE